MTSHMGGSFSPMLPTRYVDGQIADGIIPNVRQRTYTGYLNV